MPNIISFLENSSDSTWFLKNKCHYWGYRKSWEIILNSHLRFSLMCMVQSKMCISLPTLCQSLFLSTQFEARMWGYLVQYFHDFSDLVWLAILSMNQICSMLKQFFESLYVTINYTDSATSDTKSSPYLLSQQTGCFFVCSNSYESSRN
jgi:hypothetical protein